VCCAGSLLCVGIMHHASSSSFMRRWWEGRNESKLQVQATYSIAYGTLLEDHFPRFYFQIFLSLFRSFT
jgi:hypothetical protein